MNMMSYPLEPVEKVLERNWEKYFPERKIGHVTRQSMSSYSHSSGLNIGYTPARRYLEGLNDYRVKSLISDVETKAALADNLRWLRMYRRRTGVSTTASTTVSTVTQTTQSVFTTSNIQTYQQADQTFPSTISPKYGGMSENSSGDSLIPLKYNSEINSSCSAVREHLDSFKGKQLKSLGYRVDAETVLEDSRRWLQNYSRRCCSRVTQTTQSTVTVATNLYETYGQNVLNKIAVMLRPISRYICDG